MDKILQKLFFFLEFFSSPPKKLEFVAYMNVIHLLITFNDVRAFSKHPNEN